MAAAPASRPEFSACDACGRRLEGDGAPHVCGACGEPQRVAAGAQDYFEALGAPRTFTQDLPEVEKRFYRWSRTLHPDRFATREAESRARSLERMSLLNEAWHTLKSPDRRREHLLELEGVSADRSRAVLDLASDWFEVQDQLVENPREASDVLIRFERVLSDRILSVEGELAKRESEWDSSRARVALEAIVTLVQTAHTLRSLSEDVARRKATLQVNT